MHGYIYATTCRLSDGVYIGMHHGCPAKRYYGSGSVIKKAVKKYGVENFDTIVLETCQNESDLRAAEIWHISYFRFIGARLYNICPGGEGTGAGRDSPRFGKTISDDQKKRIGDAARGRPASFRQIEHAREMGLYHQPSVEARAAGMDKRRRNFPDWSDLIKRAVAHTKGKKRIFSEEHRASLKQSWVARKQKADNNKIL